jgi:putative membrane protein
MGGYEMPFNPAYGYYSTGDWLWSIFSTVVFIGLFVAAIMLLVRVFSGPHRGVTAARPMGAPLWYGPGSGSTGRPAWQTPEATAEGAERILAERYARGEISEEEFRSRLEVIFRSRSGWPGQGSAMGAEPPAGDPGWQPGPQQPAPQPPQQAYQGPYPVQEPPEPTEEVK